MITTIESSWFSVRVREQCELLLRVVGSQSEKRTIIASERVALEPEFSTGLRQLCERVALEPEFGTGLN